MVIHISSNRIHDGESSGQSTGNKNEVGTFSTDGVENAGKKLDNAIQKLDELESLKRHTDNKLQNQVDYTAIIREKINYKFNPSDDNMISHGVMKNNETKLDRQAELNSGLDLTRRTKLLGTNHQ